MKLRQNLWRAGLVQALDVILTESISLKGVGTRNCNLLDFDDFKKTFDFHYLVEHLAFSSNCSTVRRSRGGNASWRRCLIKQYHQRLREHYPIYCSHCLHCLHYIILLALLPLLWSKEAILPLYNVAILLYMSLSEWWSGWLDNPKAAMTTRAPVVLTNCIKRHQTHHLDVSLDDHNEVVGGWQRGLESL